MQFEEGRMRGMPWVLALAAVLAACGGSGGTAGTSASSSGAGPAVRPGHKEDDGGASDDDDDGGATLRARVARGFAIAPVPLATSGLTGRQRMLVGLGSYLVNAAGDCTGCHTATPSKYLAGGVPFFLDGQGDVVWTRNLTPDAATGLPLSLDQFKEALRTGRDFHPGATKMLVVMPWMYLRWESDRDLEAIYAYLRAIPAVSNAVPPDVKTGLPLPPAIPFPGAYTDGDVDRPLVADHQSFSFRRGLAIAPRALPGDLDDGARSYGVGSYLANSTIACNECHTHPDRTADGSKLNTAAYLTGGTVFKTPPPLQPVTGYVRAMSANLEGATHGFLSEPGSTFARFQGIMDTGTLVDETPARPLGFPMLIVAHSLKNLVEPDLQALWDYLSTTQRTAGVADVARQPPARWCAAATDCRSGETCDAGECVGGACQVDADCGACQTCGGSACQAPLPTSACLLTAQ
jgi:hypothetical protein